MRVCTCVHVCTFTMGLQLLMVGWMGLRRAEGGEATMRDRRYSKQDTASLPIMYVCTYYA